MQTVENVQGMQWPFATTGAALNMAGANPNIGQYYGAESAGVVPQLENIFGQQQAQATGNWQQQAGGIGADRIAVAQSELANQQGLSAGQTLSQIMGQAVGQAQTGAGLQQQAGTNIANIGTGAQSAALQGATAELQSGTLAQQQLQNQQNAQYENILQQISWPFQTNQYLGSMAAGVTPAMGGTGITSGNTKSSTMNTSGLGKGATALGGKMLGMNAGGSVPWAESGSIAPEDINVEGYDLGGTVDPLEIATGRAPHLQAGGQETSAGNFPSVAPPGSVPLIGGTLSSGIIPETAGIQQTPAPTSPQGAPAFNMQPQGQAPTFQFPWQQLFSSGKGRGGWAPGGAVPMQDGGANFTPATGQTVSVPFGPAVGGPQSFVLTDSSVPAPPNLHAAIMNIPTVPSGTEGLNIRGPQGAPTFANPFTSSGGQQGQAGASAGASKQSGTPFDAMLASLMNERQGLLGSLAGGAGGTGSAAAGAMGWAGQLPSIGGGWATKHDSGGRVPPIGSIVFGDTAGGPPSDTKSKEQKDSSGVEVGNLLGNSRSGVPAIGDKTIIPQLPVQGRPSPMQQWLMTNRQPQAQAQAPSGGGQNPFTKSPNFGGQNYNNFIPGVSGPDAAAAAKAGVQSGLSFDPMTGAVGTPDTLKGTPTPPIAPVSAAPPPPPPAGVPTAFLDTGDMGGLGDIFAAEGGAILLPPHMDIGGDPMGSDFVPSPLTAGMGTSSPFTPQGEISGSILPYSIESNIYNQGNQQQPQPQQIAQMAGASDADAAAAQQGSAGTPFNTPQPPATSAPTGAQWPYGYRPPQTPPSPDAGHFPSDLWNPVIQGAKDWWHRQTTPTSTPFEPTPPISIPRTEDTAFENSGIRNTLEVGMKPVIPMPQPRPPEAPSAPPIAPSSPPNAAGTPAQTSTAPQPSISAAAQNILGMKPVDALNQINPMWRVGINPSKIPTTGTIGDWLKQNPADAQEALKNPQAQAWLKQKGVTDQDLQVAMQPPAGGENTPQQQASQGAPQVPTYSGMAGTIAPIWRGAGASENAIKGVIYNIGKESSFNPGLRHPDQPRYAPTDERHYAHGLYQHGADQWTGLEQYARARNADWRDPSIQSAYEIDNLRRNHPNVWKRLNAADSWQDAAKEYAKWLAPSAPNLRQRLADIDRASEPTGGGEKGTSQTVSRETQAPAGQYPAVGTRERYEKPPGTPWSEAGNFLTTLGTGDTTAYARGLAARLGYFQQAADYDDARAHQYGSSTPVQNGAALANEVGATKNLVGAVAGHSEQNAHPGTISNAAATGQSPPGATVQPAGGAPSGQAAPPAGGVPPLPAGTRGQVSPEQQIVQNAIDAAGSRNMKLAGQGIQQLTELAQRGNIQAQTALHQMQAAGVGWQPYGKSNLLVNPLTNEAFIPGRGRIPMSEVFGPNAASVPGPGAGGVPSPGVGGAPSPQGAAPAVIAPLPGGQTQSQPIPADPGLAAQQQRQQQSQTAPAAAAQTIQPIKDDRAFAPQPAQPTDQSGRPTWPLGSSNFEKEVETAHAEAAAGRQSENILLALEREYAKLSGPGVAAPGFAFNHRLEILSAVDTLVRALGGEGVEGEKLGSGESINKLSTQLTTAAVKGLGREPGYILQMLKTSMIPGAQMNPQAFAGVVAEMHALNRRALERSDAIDHYSGFYGTTAGFEAAFDRSNPPQKYDYMAELSAARGRNGGPMSQKTLDDIRRNPDNIIPFANAWKVRPEAFHWVTTH